MYIYVGDEADTREVAADLRNQAATIILMQCEDERVARKMGEHLQKRAFGKQTSQTRGDGGASKSQGKGKTTRGDGGASKSQGKGKTKGKHKGKRRRCPGRP